MTKSIEHSFLTTFIDLTIELKTKISVKTKQNKTYFVGLQLQWSHRNFHSCSVHNISVENLGEFEEMEVNNVNPFLIIEAYKIESDLSFVEIESIIQMQQHNFQDIVSSLKKGRRFTSIGAY